MLHTHSLKLISSHYSCFRYYFTPLAEAAQNLKKIEHNGSLLKYWNGVRNNILKMPPFTLCAKFFVGWWSLSLNFLFFWITHYVIIFRENIKWARLFGVKFLIKTLITYWPKLHTKAGNSSPPPPKKVKKITIFTIWNTFLNVSNQDYIFVENIKRKKLFPIKFSLRTLSQLSKDLIRKIEISV